MNNPPTTLPEALEQISSLTEDLARTEEMLEKESKQVEALDRELNSLQDSACEPAELQAFGDKWAKLRNGFIGHAACNLTFATMDHQGKRYTAHGKGLLEAISRCEENFAKGISCRTSIQLPVHA